MAQRNARVGIFGIAAFVSIGCAHAQKGGGAPPAGSGPPAVKNAEAASGVGKYANWDQLQAHQHGSLEFTGKVAVRGGTLLWDPVPVVIVCSGKVAYNTRTDPQGGFRLAAAPQQSEVVSSAGDPKRWTPAQLIGCQAHAELAGFQSSVARIMNVSILDDSDLGTLMLTRDEKAPGAALSSTTGAAPKDAQKSFEKARGEFFAHQTNEARKDLERTVHDDPQFAEAWYQLGKLAEPQKPEEALADYHKAIAADPQFVPPYEGIAALGSQQKQWPQVVEATREALKLEPEGTAQLWYFSAVGNANGGDKKLAEESARRSLAMDPSHLAPNTEQLLAVLLAGRGDYTEALEHLRHCLGYVAPGPNADLIKQQIAQLEKVVPPSSH